jgi:translation initiation factor 3 subunit A
VCLQDKLKEFEKALEEERRKCLAERKVRRKEERRAKWLKEREEEEERKREEELRLQEEEARRKQEEEEQKKKIRKEMEAEEYRCVVAAWRYFPPPDQFIKQGNLWPQSASELYWPSEVSANFLRIEGATWSA